MARRPASRAAQRRLRVRSTARAVLLLGIGVALLAPVSWERLPDFKAVVVPRSPGDRPSTPGPGIDPAKEPDAPKIIRPSPLDPRSVAREFKYLSFFGDQPPYVSNCRPVPFEIRTAAAPVNGAGLIFEAMQRLANSTGLSFEFTGYTDEIYAFNERKTRYSWEQDRGPLWIGWATDNEVPDLGPKADTEPYAVGVGGPVAYERGNGQHEILGGGVVLRAGEDLANVFGPGANEGNVLLHELGHAMGLDHVDFPGQQMNPSLNETGPDGYAPGDRAGLQDLTEACDR